MQKGYLKLKCNLLYPIQVQWELQWEFQQWELQWRSNMPFSLWLGYNKNMSYANGIEAPLSQSKTIQGKLAFNCMFQQQLLRSFRPVFEVI